MEKALKKNGLYSGEFRWGFKSIRVGKRVTLSYDSMIVLVANYDATRPEVYFVSSMGNFTNRKLKKLLSKDKKAYYDFICEDFYSNKPKIKWMKFNDADALRITEGIKLGCYDMVGDVFGISDITCLDFDRRYNENKGLLSLLS